jgi:hypothetical protein
MNIWWQNTIRRSDLRTFSQFTTLHEGIQIIFRSQYGTVFDVVKTDGSTEAIRKVQVVGTKDVISLKKKEKKSKKVKQDNMTRARRRKKRTSRTSSGRVITSLE